MCVVAAAAAFAQVPSSQHVILVIDENSSYNDVVANMPWLVGEGKANGYATNYESDNGGSLLDYLWLASGSCHSIANCTLPPGTHDFNCNGNDCYYPGTNTTDPITDDNIFREMNNAGISWKVYAQSYSAAGGTITTPDNNNGTSYYRRHNGSTWYSDVLNNVDGSSGKVVDLSQLSVDLANNALPRYMIIVPDGNHDAHDCPVGMSSCTEAQKLSAADSFLSGTLAPVLATSDFQPGGDGLLIVTFDECGDGTDGGCGASVYTAVIGPKVIPHTVSTIPYKHENTLRTTLDSLGIKNYPGASATAADMSDFFDVSDSKPVVTVSTPSNNATVNSPVNIQASATPSTGHSITGWWIYVDSKGVYNGGAVNNINTNVTMANGTHTVIVRAWDSSGAFGDQTLTLTVTAKTTKPVVTVSTPTPGSNVDPSFTVKASATPSSGHSITGWWIYLDSVGVYNAGSVNSITATIKASTGSHTLVIRAWDSSGAYGDQTISVTTKTVAVNVTSPSNNGSSGSPVNVQANASSMHNITGWHIYVDSADDYSGGAVTSINTNVNMSAGTHTVVVRAWDSTGAYGDQTIKVTVP